MEKFERRSGSRKASGSGDTDFGSMQSGCFGGRAAAFRAHQIANHPHALVGRSLGVPFDAQLVGQATRENPARSNPS
jgi:hypothetical protein